MKKSLLIAFIFSFGVVCTMNAQRGLYKSGFKTGVNISSLNSDGDISAIEDSRIGYQATFFLEIPLDATFSFQPELQYSAQGAKNEDFRANYINLPLTLKIHASEFLNFHIGGQAGVKIWEWENQDNFDSLSYGALGGIGINLSEDFFIEGRYVFGFSDLLDDDSSLNFQDEIKNNYIQLSLGIRI